MNKKNNLTLAERLMFVETVVTFSKNENNYEPALYDYAFRMATVIFFTDANVEEMTQEEMESLAFSKEITDMMREAPRKFVLETLNKACREKITMEREIWMTAYDNALRNQPWEKIVDAVTQLADEFNKQFSAESLEKMALNLYKNQTKGTELTSKE